MPSADIKGKLRAFILSNFMLDSGTADFRDEDSFLQKGIIDSMGVLELMAYIRKEFQIEVKPRDVVPENFDNVNSLERFIQSRMSCKI